MDKIQKKTHLFLYVTKYMNNIDTYVVLIIMKQHA